MASIYKRGRNYFISYISNGHRKVKSLKTSDEKMAKFLKKEYEVKQKKGQLQDTSQKSTEAYFAEYLEDVSYRKKSTNRSELSMVKQFLGMVPKKTINGFNQKDILVYLKLYESNPPKTYNNQLIGIKRFFRPAAEKGYILKNPTDGIHLKRLPQALPKFFTDEDYSRIEEAAKGHYLYTMIVTARYTGLRLRELIHLEWEDFNWDTKTVKVLNKEKYGHTVKNYQIRVVPISDELRDKLRPFIKKEGLCFPANKGFNKGTKYSEGGPKKALKGIFRQVGLDKKWLGWHQFRHTFASRLVQNNVPLYKVSKWLGHSSLAVTQIYAHYAPTYDLDIEKLELVHHSEKHNSIHMNTNIISGG